MERRDLFENDLTEEHLPPGEERDDVAHDLKLDPGIDPDGEPQEPVKPATPKRG
jgi:hypothetical protein